MANPNLKYFGYYFAASDGIADISSSNGLDQFKRNMDICEDHCNLVMIQIGTFDANKELMDYAIAKGLKIILVSNHIYKIKRNSTTREFEIQNGSSVNLATDSQFRDYITKNSSHFFGIYFIDEPFWSQGLTGGMTKDHWLLADKINQLYLKLQNDFGSIPHMAPFAYASLNTISTDWGKGKDQRLINNLRFEYTSVSGAYINAGFKDFKPVRDYYTTLRRVWIDEAVDKFKDNRRIFVTGDAVRAISPSSDKDTFEKLLIQRSTQLFDVCKSDDRVIAYIPFLFPSNSDQEDGAETLPNLLIKFKEIGKAITGK